MEFEPRQLPHTPEFAIFRIGILKLLYVYNANKPQRHAMLDPILHPIMSVYKLYLYKYFFGILALRRLYTTYAPASMTCTATRMKNHMPILGLEARSTVTRVSHHITINHRLIRDLRPDIFSGKPSVSPPFKPSIVECNSDSR